MDQDQCRILGTSHQSGWLVELKALLDAVDSIDGLVVGSNLAVAVDSSLVAPVAVVAVDSKLVAAALGSNLVVEVAVAEVAVAEVAVVAEAGSAVFEWEPQGGEAMMFCRLLEKT